MKFDHEKFISLYKSQYGALDSSQTSGLGTLLGFLEQDSDPNAFWAGPLGHVAYVAQVNGDGQPTDFGYERARKIWNASIDKHPGIIARCAGVADVMAAVNFAHENQLLVAVRSGGPNVSGRGFWCKFY
jgi:hypothetical protein